MTIDSVRAGDKVIGIYEHGTARERRAAYRVKSVGPKWITTTSGTKFQRENGFGAFGWTIFASEQHANEVLRRRRAWLALSHATRSYSAPSGISTEDIEAALTLVTVDRKDGARR